MSRRKKKGVSRTLVALVQDKSGSMSSLRDSTISGTNEYIQTLKSEAEGEVLVTLTQFDTRVTDVFTTRPLGEIEDLARNDYVPGGMTALNDAIGRTIRSTEKGERKDDKVVMVIMTDGFENSSREYSKSTILKLIEDKRKDGWEFIYLGAGEESWAGAVDLGLTPDQTFNYGKNDVHHRISTQDVATATVASFKSRRGDYASTAYLASSPIKLRVEAEARIQAKPKPRRRVPVK